MKAAISSDCDINLQRLVETRFLLQANSGGGKSWAIRRLLEQTHGHVQQIVLDVEDEFYTLREELDYVLVRREDGDCVPEVRSAGLLARRLLELGVSAIISIYEMKHHERIAFVKAFLDAMVNAPKALWHPVLVIVDEAHIFCPENAKAESAGSVIDLMTRGRKRGFCGILATQRISKLNKDAAAEANNKMIGRAAIDIDMKRAADELGFRTKEDALSLRTLKPGEFYVFGPAISDQVRKIKVGDVKTTHPKAGAAQVPIAPPKQKVLALLSKLGDLPKEAHEELVTIDQLRRELTNTRTELTRAKNAQPKALEAKEPTTRDQETTVRAAELQKVKRALEAAMKFIIDISTRNFDTSLPADEIRKAIQGAVENALQRLEKVVERRQHEFDELKQSANKILARMKDLVSADIPVNVEVRHNEPFSVAPVPPPRQPKSAPADGNSNGAVPSGGLKRIMVALAQRPGLSAKQIGVRAGLSSSSGTFGTYLGRLRSSGWVDGSRDAMRLTDDGVAALGAYDPLPEGPALYEHWRSELGNSGASRILTVLFEAYPNTLSKSEVGERASISSTSGTFGTYLGKLRSLELVTGSSELKATDEFFQ